MHERLSVGRRLRITVSGLAAGAVAVGGGVTPARAATAEWLGFGTLFYNTNWSEANNWILGDVPQQGDNVLFPGALAPLSTFDLGYGVNEVLFAPRNGLSEGYIVRGTVKAASVRNTTDKVQILDAVTNATPGLVLDTYTGVSSAGVLSVGIVDLKPVSGTGGLTRPRVTFRTSADGINVTYGITSTAGGSGTSTATVERGIVRVGLSVRDVSTFAGNWVVGDNATLMGRSYYSNDNDTSLGVASTPITLGNNATLAFPASDYTLPSPTDTTFPVYIGHAITGTGGRLQVDNGDWLQSGTLSGKLTKAGPRTLTLTRIGAGLDFTVESGEAATVGFTTATGANAMSAITVANEALFQMAVGTQIDTRSLGGTGSVRLMTSSRLRVAPAAPLTVNTLLYGDGTLQIGGGSSVLFTRANTLTGTVLVDASTLIAQNTTGSATGSGTVNANSGARVSGSGRIAGNVVVGNGATIAPSRADAPGQFTGTLTVGGLDLTGGGTLAVEFNGITQGTQVDLLNVNNGAGGGNALLTGGRLDIARLSNFFPASGTFPAVSILKTAGTRSGLFASVGGVRVNDTYSFAVTYDGQNAYARLAGVGDVNLDGKQDYTDLYDMGKGYGLAGTQQWLTGDLNGDGATNITDLRLASSYIPLLTPQQFATLKTYNYQEWYDYGTLNGYAVPEPAALATLSLAGLLLARRRR